jgi:lysophospholipase L1-like esterase
LFLISSCKSQIPEAKSVIDLPGIENISIDGNPAEWEKVKNYRLWADALGRYAEPSDFEASMKAGWNMEGLMLLFEVCDESFVSDTLNPWNGDAIEIFLASFRGSENIMQISIIPFEEGDIIKIQGLDGDDQSRTFSGNIKSVTKTIGNKRFTEVEIGFLNNGVTSSASPGQNKRFAFQVYTDDADINSEEKNKLIWYPVGQSYNSSSSMYAVNLCETRQTDLTGSSRVVIEDNELITLYVFGAVSGDKIGIYRNGALLTSIKSKSKSAYLPDTVTLSSTGLNIENDSLFVTINGESLCLHELFLAPRLYNKVTEKRFDREIRNFIFMDRQSFPPENATLFIGSSSIVRWETLKEDFPELQVIKRGFGGSTSPEALMYIDQIAIPYKPSKIVYYEGDNDIPMGMSGEEIRDNVKAFIEKVHVSLPHTRVYIISPKPSINRMHFWDKYRYTHKLLRELADEYENVEYADVASPMFDKEGNLNHSLFVEDGIHMNQDGYAIWTDVLKKVMKIEN